MESKEFFTDDYKKLNEKASCRYILQNVEISAPQEKFLNLVIQLLECPDDFKIESFDAYSEQIILDYLYYSHELYVNKFIPEIEQSISLLKRDPSLHMGSIYILEVLFNDYKTFLEEHISFENESVFPVIQNILDHKNNKNAETQHQYANLAEFYLNHTDTEKDLKKIKQLLEDIEPSQTSKSVYTILCSQILWLEKDLLIHSKLEEEVLLPRMMNESLS